MENISKKSLLKKFNFKKKCPDKQQGVFKNTLRTTKSTRKTLICLASSTYYQYECLSGVCQQLYIIQSTARGPFYWFFDIRYKLNSLIQHYLVYSTRLHESRSQNNSKTIVYFFVYIYFCMLYINKYINFMYFFCYRK